MTVADQLRQQGLEKGLEKGRVKEAEKIALNLLQHDQAVDFVAQMTGLPKSRVQILALEVKG